MPKKYFSQFLILNVTVFPEVASCVLLILRCLPCSCMKSHLIKLYCPPPEHRISALHASFNGKSSLDVSLYKPLPAEYQGRRCLCIPIHDIFNTNDDVWLEKKIFIVCLKSTSHILLRYFQTPSDTVAIWCVNFSRGSPLLSIPFIHKRMLHLVGCMLAESFIRSAAVQSGPCVLSAVMLSEC